jgi:hypothetical protein
MATKLSFRLGLGALASAIISACGADDPVEPPPCPPDPSEHVVPADAISMLSFKPVCRDTPQ